ncbi:MAG TPA: hypothetical protein DCK95_10085 [Anaerolineaceae bacterium]|uniref:Cell wall hydrolase/autolysin family protein n=1 Tax=Anaerolinea thermophila TaxID=167964 RepID=A0A124FN14_9CHLR|nr:MAG: Cell wall hydrolase/autolysin family protein [Anaerolinea thermophila]HAF62658.1 hypothetical protein [Anaerolineaceae bacterium]
MTKTDSGTQTTFQEGKPKSDFSAGRVLQTIVLVAAVLASVFTLWNPYSLFSEEQTAQSDQANQPISSAQQSSTIGILVGHWKIDSGAVCENGIVEADVNEAIANQVSSKMNALGYPVKLLSQNDLDLINYRGPVLIALFSGSCEEQPENKSGFTIGTTLSTSDLNTSNALAVCMGEIYQSSTKLDFTYQIISLDHPAYPLFDMVNPQTPMIYLEMGSLLYDQAVLIDNSEKVANGIVNGILCYLDTLEGQQ